MLKLSCLVITLALLANSLPQYEEYGEYTYEDYEDYYSDPVERSDASTANRFSRQTFSTNPIRNTGTRVTSTTTTRRPTFQRQQSSRQTANPPLGPYRFKTTN